MERRGLALAPASGAQLNGVGAANRTFEMLRPVMRRGHAAAALLIGIFFAFGAIFAMKPPKDVASLSLGVGIATVVAAFLGGRPRFFFYRLSAYSAAVILCFLLSEGRANASIWDNWAVNLYLAGIGLVVLASITFHQEHNFRLSPQDLLMALIVIVVPALDLDRQFNFPVSIFLLQVSVLFYTVEYVLSANGMAKTLIPISAVLSLTIVAFAGFLR
jgi:hypothetical protein